MVTPEVEEFAAFHTEPAAEKLSSLGSSCLPISKAQTLYLLHDKQNLLVSKGATNDNVSVAIEAVDTASRICEDM